MSIERLLVANRGEVASRIFATARALGITTLAVFSDADADAPFVREADAALRVGPGPAAQSYLCIDAILEAALRLAADAVHPGYGFLAENAEFARRCAQAGLTFVGPSPEAIAAMGDKAVAKRTMIAAGVTVVPGIERADPEDAALAAEVERLGLPVLIKAVAGGGGRGMRAVASVDELPAALCSARSEAQAAFGNGALFIERNLRGARHVEIQVVADAHGHVHHLGERECSVQRRHQKVIEEAPSPAVDAQLRARMGAAAVAAATAIAYVGVGTVEFLLDDAGQFYFLEMNTRLQVEHSVTEWVTGVDLVQLQIEAAEGRVIAAVAHEIRGHAIEARVYCEDPYAGFLPQLGRVQLWRPAKGAQVRVDAGVATGQEITAYYDAMVAKISAHGSDREQARRRLRAAVRETVLLGPTTNRALLLQLLDDPLFVQGQFKTDTLDGRGSLSHDAVLPRAAVWALAAVLLSGEGHGAAWHSAGHTQWSVTLQCGAQTRCVQLHKDNGERVVVAALGEDTTTVKLCAQTGGTVWAELDGVRQHFTVARSGEAAVSLDDAGHAFAFFEPAAHGLLDTAVVGDEVRTPMGGRVLSVAVSVGDDVAAGQMVAAVEAMKMEHRVIAPRAGTIATVAVAAADQVVAGQLLATLTPAASTTDNAT